MEFRCDKLLIIVSQILCRYKNTLIQENTLKKIQYEFLIDNILHINIKQTYYNKIFKKG